MRTVLNQLQRPLATLYQSLETIPAARQQEIMYWVGGLSPLATNVVTPVVTHYRFKNSNLSLEEQRFNVRQETARQAVSGVLQLASFFGGAWLFGKASGQNSKTLVAFLGGVISAFVSYAFIRPLISSEIILRWLYAPASEIGGGQNPGTSLPVRQQQRFAAYLEKTIPRAALVRVNASGEGGASLVNGRFVHPPVFEKSGNRS